MKQIIVVLWTLTNCILSISEMGTNTLSIHSVVSNFSAPSGQFCPRMENLNTETPSCPEKFSSWLMRLRCHRSPQKKKASQYSHTSCLRFSKWRHADNISQTVSKPKPKLTCETTLKESCHEWNRISSISASYRRTGEPERPTCQLPCYYLRNEAS